MAGSNHRQSESTKQKNTTMNVNNDKKVKVGNLINRRGTMVFSIFMSIWAMLFSATETNAQISTKLTTLSPVNWQGSGSMYPPFPNGQIIRFRAKLEYIAPRSYSPPRPLAGRRVDLVFNPKAVDLRFSPRPQFSKTFSKITDINGIVTWDVKVNDIKLDTRRGTVGVLPKFMFQDIDYSYRSCFSLANFALYRR
jgi:hypothetical protein